MSEASDFFNQRREWSRWKHEILRRYLPKFAAILGSRHSIVYYVDGFAGAGVYGGDPPIPGSPLIGAEIAATMAATQRRSYELRCINVEPNSQYFGELCNSTSAFHPRVVLNLQGTFRERLREILEIIGSCPTLFFLDPFGYKGMEWDVISTLADRASAAKTELLINFSVPIIDRAAGWLDSYDHPAAPSFVQGLNDLLGSDAWQPIVSARLAKEHRDGKLTEFYVENLREAFHGIVARYPVRTREGRLKYHLLFVTRALRGCREMSDVIYRVDHDYESAREEALKAFARQLPLLDPLPVSASELRERAVPELAEDIYTLGKPRGSMLFGTIQNQLAEKWFGRLIEPHFRRACRLLETQGRIDLAGATRLDEKTLIRFL